MFVQEQLFGLQKRKKQIKENERREVVHKKLALSAQPDKNYF